MPNKGGKSKRGFAAMSDEKQREIASMGGKASHGGGRKAGRAMAALVAMEAAVAAVGAAVANAPFQPSKNPAPGVR